MADYQNRNVGWGFPFMFMNGKVRSVGGESESRPFDSELREAIVGNAVHLLATNKYERVMHPHFGVSTRVYLFDPLHSRRPAMLGLEIAQQFAMWVDRVRLAQFSAELTPERASLQISAVLESLEYPVQAGLDVTI